VSVREDDAGLLIGWGVFETLRVVDGQPELYEAHLHRLGRGAATLGLPVDLALVRRRVARALARHARGADLRLRITLTAGPAGVGLPPPAAVTRPTLLIQLSAAAPRTARPVRLALVDVRRPSPRVLPSHVKSTSYAASVLARHAALALGAEEALLLSERGHVAEADTSNIFWIDRGVLHTPSLATGALEGVTRGAVIALARRLGVRVREGLYAPAALERADEIFLTSAIRGIQPVARTGQRRWPATRRLIRAYASFLVISSMLPPGTGL